MSTIVGFISGHVKTTILLKKPISWWSETVSKEREREREREQILRGTQQEAILINIYDLYFLYICIYFGTKTFVVVVVYVLVFLTLSPLKIILVYK